MSYEQRIDNPDNNPDGRSWDLDAEMEALNPASRRNVAAYAGELALPEDH